MSSESEQKQNVKQLENKEDIPLLTQDDIIMDQEKIYDDIIIISQRGNELKRRVQFKHPDMAEWLKISGLATQQETNDESIDPLENTILPYYRQLILISSVSPKFNSIEEIKNKDPNFQFYYGKHIDQVFRRIRFL